MARTSDPDFVSGRKGRYEIQPPITHPPQCVCDVCPKYRQIAEDWDRPIVIRIRRRSRYPDSRVESSAGARRLRDKIERQLQDAVRLAEEQRRASANAVTFGQLCTEYREWLQREGKRYDRHKYTINGIENFIGPATDPTQLRADDHRRLMAHLSTEKNLGKETQLSYSTKLLAILNHAVREGLIEKNPLEVVRRPTVVRTAKPETWSHAEVALLLGPAMDRYEAEQKVWNEKVRAEKKSASLRGETYVPLRGFCLVAYFMLVRPVNNLLLTWDELTLHPKEDRGSYALAKHKNQRKGITAEGPLAAPLVRYLRSIRPANASGTVHPNPETGLPYVDIGKQWDRLIAIANELLVKNGEKKLTGRRAQFFTWRHTGASYLAEHTNNPVLIVEMMGDTSIATVMKHYFNLDHAAKERLVSGWELPQRPAGL